MSARVEPDVNTALEHEAKRRGQTKSELVETFLRDGLARYDSSSEQIIQTQLAMLEHLKRLQDMIGAVMHLEVEQSVLAQRQNPDETPEAYKERLLATYRKAVFDALAKGARIVSVSGNKLASAKVARDH